MPKNKLVLKVINKYIHGDDDIFSMMLCKIERFVKKYQRKPHGILFGPRDYLKLCAQIEGHPEIFTQGWSYNYEDGYYSFAGMSIIVKQSEGLETILPPNMAHHFAIASVE